LVINNMVTTTAMLKHLIFFIYELVYVHNYEVQNNN
jgi:hypothetical protein